MGANGEGCGSGSGQRNVHMTYIVTEVWQNLEASEQSALDAFKHQSGHTRHGPTCRSRLITWRTSLSTAWQFRRTSCDPSCTFERFLGPGGHLEKGR